MASPLGLPRRLAASVGNSIDAAGELPVFQQKVLEHLASMDEVMSEHMSSMDDNTAALIELLQPMRDDMAELNARSVQMEGRIEQLERALAGQVHDELTQANGTMGRMEQSVATIAKRVPDPDEPGALAKARDAITGDS
jgi:methyl-accepting chemotaxis protein